MCCLAQASSKEFSICNTQLQRWSEDGASLASVDRRFIFSVICSWSAWCRSWTFHQEGCHLGKTGGVRDEGVDFTVRRDTYTQFWTVNGYKRNKIFTLEKRWCMIISETKDSRLWDKKSIEYKGDAMRYYGKRMLG